MINNKHKYIFIHIPKTGGTSIESALNIKQEHKSHEYYKKELKQYTDFFVFTIVRNPFDRSVSDYKWTTNTKYPYPAKELKEMFMNKSFKYFLKTYYNLQYKDVKSFRDFNWFKDHHLTHCRGQLDLLNPVSEIDYIIRFENLQEDFDIVCDKIGIPHQQLPHLNESNHKHYTEYYDEETKQIVAKKYAKDIEYFGYEFGA
jgi:chondroitin 4-sulfotransferase 11